MKYYAVLLALAAAATALPKADDGIHARATKKWEAAGGCQEDWAGRCHSQCTGEAKKKGYKCKNVDSAITSSGCWLGWNVCDCTCFY
ncbi:hypothetical protein VTH82DRAFT_6730 [Thermothelomyces myriococcoides]